MSCSLTRICAPPSRRTSRAPPPSTLTTRPTGPRCAPLVMRTTEATSIAPMRTLPRFAGGRTGGAGGAGGSAGVGRSAGISSEPSGRRRRSRRIATVCGFPGIWTWQKPLATRRTTPVTPAWSPATTRTFFPTYCCIPRRARAPRARRRRAAAGAVATCAPSSSLESPPPSTTQRVGGEPLLDVLRERRRRAAALLAAPELAHDDARAGGLAGGTAADAVVVARVAGAFRCAARLARRHRRRVLRGELRLLGALVRRDAVGDELAAEAAHGLVADDEPHGVEALLRAALDLAHAALVLAVQDLDELVLLQVRPRHLAALVVVVAARRPLLARPLLEDRRRRRHAHGAEWLRRDRALGTLARRRPRGPLGRRSRHVQRISTRELHFFRAAWS